MFLSSNYWYTLAAGSISYSIRQAEIKKANIHFLELLPWIVSIKTVTPATINKAHGSLQPHSSSKSDSATFTIL